MLGASVRRKFGTVNSALIPCVDSGAGDIRQKTKLLPIQKIQSRFLPRRVKDDAGDLVAQFQGLAYRKKDKLPV